MKAESVKRKLRAIRQKAEKIDKEDHRALREMARLGEHHEFDYFSYTQGELDMIHRVLKIVNRGP